MNVILIRHGKTLGNVEKRYIGGRTDQPLSNEGIEELKSLKYPHADKVYVSPMKRCIQTAKIIFPNHRQNIVEGFREMDFGVFEGKNHNELNGDKEYQKWIDSMGLSPIPEGESFEIFAKRCSKSFYDVIGNENSENTALVVHGGTIMALLHILGGYNPTMHIVGNGRGYICSFENNRLRIKEEI